MSSSEDDSLQLTAETMKALNEFYQEETQKRLEQDNVVTQNIDDLIFDEDWVSFQMLL